MVSEAQAAIDEARRSGDIQKLQAVLIAEADKREKQIVEGAGDYLERCREIAAISFLRGDIDEASRRIDSILRLVPSDLDALNRWGHSHSLRGLLPAAEHCYQRVLELSADDEAGQAVAYGNLGNVYQTRGDLDAAEDMHKKALGLDEKLGRLEGMAATYSNLGVVYQKRGDLKSARDLWTRSRDLYAKIGMPHMVKKLQDWLDSLAP